MDPRKHLCSLARVALPGLGFGFICMGAYLVSLPLDYHYVVRVIFAYLFITCGFLALLAGVFWSICHGMRSKMFQQRRRRHAGAHDHIYTVDRPSCYPPSYEDSQQSYSPPADSVMVVNEEDPRIILAPPLYTHDSSETPDESFSRELPPPYSETQPHSPSSQQEQEQASPSH